MAQIIFLVTLFFEAVYAGILCVSIFAPKNRVWPPPKQNSWQFYMTWLIIIAAFLGVIWLGFLDRNSFVLGHWSRFVVGGILMFVGYLLYYWARHHLGWKMMMGIKEKFIVTGIYQYIRNPMYVGDNLLFLGAAIICNSLLVYIVAIIGIFLFFITPFAEESWLREQYGTPYDDYVSRVPQFIPSLRKMMKQQD